MGAPPPKLWFNEGMSFLLFRSTSSLSAEQHMLSEPLATNATLFGTRQRNQLP